jgi:bacteriorhodopsin
MNEYSIPFIVGIGFFGTLLFLYSYLSFHFKGNVNERIHYSLTCGIIYCPLVVYSMQLLDLYIENDDIKNLRILDYFYIEWIFATPLILIQLMKIIKLRLSLYLIFLFLDILMILSGFVFHKIFEVKKNISFIFLGIACFCFVSILSFLYYLYYKHHKIIFLSPTLMETGNIKSKINRFMILDSILSVRIYKILIGCLTITWSFYPIIMLLQKYEVISVLQTIIGYVVLDGISKGIFSLFLIISREIVVRDTLFLNFCRRKVFQIHPELVLPERSKPILITVSEPSKSIDSIDEALRQCENV